MRSLVSALLPPDSDPRSYTPQEQANIDTVLKLRSAPFLERRNYMHQAMVRHRWGFASLADVTGMKDGAGGHLAPGERPCHRGLVLRRPAPAAASA